jgi:hypothetical protein
MTYPAEMYLLKPEQFADMLKWERFAEKLKDIVKAIYVSGLENQVEGMKRGTVRA